MAGLLAARRPVQRELLAYKKPHTEALPSAGGFTASSSTISYTAEAARLKAALQPLADAGKVLVTDDGTRVYFAETGATSTELVAALTTGGLPKPAELAAGLLSHHNVFVFSGSRVTKLETLFGSTTLDTKTDHLDRKTSRLPTHFERTEAAKVFRTSVDLDRFVLVEDHAMSVGGYARTTPTAVNMPPGSLNRTDIMPWLIHEFTHAWQYQHGVSLASTLVEAVRGRYDYGGAAQLVNDRKLGKRFSDYTTEQQADICSDYYELLSTGCDVSAHLPFIKEVRDPSTPAPPTRSPVLDLNDRLLLDAKLPLRKVEAKLAAGSCTGDEATKLETEAKALRATVKRIQGRIDGFPGGKAADVERKGIGRDIDAAEILADDLESRLSSSCAGGKTACVPVSPSVVVAGLGAVPPPGATGSTADARTSGASTAPMAFAQRLVDPASGIEGLRKGDGLRVGSADLRPRVRHLQEALNAAGAALGPDGMFGGGTAAALMDFQAQRGLPTAPYVDEVTTRLLTSPAPVEVIVTSSTFQGLRLDDGLAYGTWERRPRVQALQERLTTVGFACTADGMFGRRTLAALHGFQTSRHLPTTEEVDVLTADALEGRTPDPDVPTACPVGEVPVLQV